MFILYFSISEILINFWKQGKINYWDPLKTGEGDFIKYLFIYKESEIFHYNQSKLKSYFLKKKTKKKQKT